MKRLSIFLVLLLLTPSLLLAQKEGEKEKEQDPEKAKQEREKNRKDLDRKEMSYNKAMATSSKKIASRARGMGLGRQFCQYLMEAVVLTDDKGARKALGFKQVKGEWVLFKGVLPKADKVKGSKREKAIESLTKALIVKHDKTCANYYWKLAEMAKKFDFPDDEKRYLNRCLSFDPKHKAARAAAGYRKGLVAGTWVTSNQARFFKIGNEGEEYGVKSEFEEGLGLKLTKYKHRRMEIAAYWNTKTVKELMKWGTSTIYAFHNMLGLKKFVRRKAINFYFLRSGDYEKFIDKFEKADKDKKTFHKRLAFCNPKKCGVSLNRFRKKDEMKYRRDRVVYLTGNKMAHSMCGSAPPWIAEGVAWNMALRMLGTKYHYSVSLAKTSSVYGDKNWSDHTQWRKYLRELVLLGEAPNASNVLVTKDFNEIADDKAAYSWSVCQWFLDEHPKKFYEYGRALKDKKKPHDAMSDAFGWTFPQFEKAWADYVKANY